MLDRVECKSWSPTHVNTEFLDACVVAAGGAIRTRGEGRDFDHAVVHVGLEGEQGIRAIGVAVLVNLLQLIPQNT